MAQVKALIQEPAGELLTGRLQRIQDDHYWVLDNEGIQAVRLAASCLLKPVPGDLVLLARTGHGCHILAVLEHGDEEYRIEVPGHLRLGADDLSLHGRQRLVMHSREVIEQRAARVATTATRITECSELHEVRAAKLDMLGREARLVFNRVQEVFGQVFSKAEQVVRSVSGTEILNLGNWLQKVRDTYSLRARNTILTAKSDVKIDGERIHMG